MCRECHELDLPEVEESWVDLFRENKDTAKVVSMFVGIPTMLFIAISLANRWMDKNW